MAKDMKITIRAMDKTKGAFSSASRGIKSVAGSIFSLKSAIMGAVGVGGLGLLVTKSMQSTDALAKTASKIGTTASALAGLRHAADITGIATTTMDMALQRFTRRTAEAAKGTGEAKGAIKELGIDARKLNQMPLDERMLTLAEAFGKVDNESDRLRLAFKLFDSEGAALVNTLALGRDGLADMLGEAEALGLTMSQDAAEGVEDANDAISRLKGLFRGLTNQTVAALAPAMEHLVTKFKDFLLSVTDADGGVEAFAQGMAKSILESVKSVLNLLQSMVNGVITTFNTLMETKDKFTGFFTADENKNARQLQREIDIIQAKIDKFDKRTRQPVRQGANNELARLQALLKEAKDSGDLDLIPQVTFGDDVTVWLEGMIANIGKVTEGTANLGQTTETEVNRVANAYQKWSEKIEPIEVQLENLALASMNNLTKAMADGITGAQNFGDAMKNMAKSVVDSLVQMMVQYYITDAIFGGLTSYFGGGKTGGFNTVRSGTGATQIPTGGIVGRAIGGSVQAGQPYMVGERGQEMFIPNQSGSIIPNNKVGGGGTVINQTINIETGVAQTVRAEISNLMPQIAESTKNAVMDARLRGGSFSKSLVGA